MTWKNIQSGDTSIEVHHSDFAGTNQITAETFGVGEDIEEEVRALKAKGITFEHYSMPNTRHQGDIHVAKDIKMACFKDPDGNILCIHNH